MQPRLCKQCQAKVEEWNHTCKGCGYHLVLEPEEKLRARYLRTPSLGALLFTQGWALGARVYVLFILSLIPAVGIAALIIGMIFGRRISWKMGSWGSWQEYTTRMRLLDGIGVAWICLLGLVYLYLRFKS